MIKSILQSTGSLLLALVVAIILLAGIEGVSAIVHPFPPDFGGTRDEVAQHVANYPTWVLVSLGSVGWGITIFVASWMTTRLGTRRHPAHGAGLGLLLFAGAIFNMAMLPYPLWYWVLELITLPAGIYFGVKIGQGISTAGNETHV